MAAEAEAGSMESSNFGRLWRHRFCASNMNFDQHMKPEAVKVFHI